MNRCGSFTTTIDETSMVQDSDNVVCSAALNHSLQYKLLNHFSGIGSFEVRAFPLPGTIGAPDVQHMGTV